MTKRVAIYVRVSTDGQTVDNQLADLNAVAQRMDWEIVHVYRDDGISGAKGRDQRPGFNELLKGITRREFDLIAAWSVCRIGRSLKDLIGFLSEIHERDIGLYLHKQGLDTSTPSGRMMFQLLGVFSEYERAMIQDRVRAGVQRKMKDPTYHHGRPSTNKTKLDAIRDFLQQGNGIHKTAKHVGCGVSVVQRVKRDMISVKHS
ncbi:recombinase family protein [Magnetovibrio blakemorei]|uniref:Resolvase n=1 Tax=Magnetovibrio blakemorei TaxID=28181 RepID=A0A1E5Q4P2_9PROT|nr:recombinase family protein [Magnetovibrio blakemorei]OEJ64939.1 resolvase [Magnetovibrio blakemorei]